MLLALVNIVLLIEFLEHRVTRLAVFYRVMEHVIVFIVILVVL